MPRHFTPALFAFLRDLAANNEREWFQDNRDRYLENVQQPALDFITDFGASLLRISPHFRADPRPNGGSLFRIHRDVRFSKDKSPYKTAVGIHFRHEAGKTAYTPGYYLHLEPGGCFVGVGLWHPDNPTLRRLRDRVAGDPDSWRKMAADREFSARFTISGESLKRPPRDVPAEHPLVEVLKLKDYTAFAPLTRRQVTSADFLAEFTELCRAGSPLVRWICGALEVPF
ncbi:MAG: DUF2461 domain-containing protein [Candidatus Krumholzibacteriia bacterium]